MHHICNVCGQYNIGSWQYEDEGFCLKCGTDFNPVETELSEGDKLLKDFNLTKEGYRKLKERCKRNIR